MKIIVFISILIVLLFPSSYKIGITNVMTFAWIFYTIYYCYNLSKVKDEKIVTHKYSVSPPNHNYSPYIRYLYNHKFDSKVFVSTIIELIIKKSISLKVDENGNCYLIDNKVVNEDLNKAEMCLKKFLFKDVGEGNYLYVNSFLKKCSSNSGYIYSVYKDFQETFEYEVTFSKYFKSNKDLIDKSTAFLIVSFILSLYNIIFTKRIIVGAVVFIVAALICKFINDLKIMEDGVKNEYKEWLKFKNYINKQDNNFDELDIYTLENYFTYAYVLDSYSNFKRCLDNNDIVDKSDLLKVVNSGLFDKIDYIFNRGINKLSIGNLLLFARNKGRR